MQVVGYIRVSTEDQAREGVSLAAQRAKIDAYALVKDWRVVEVIQDDMTAKHLRRRGVQRLLALVARRQVGAVIVDKLDRLTRSVKDLNSLVELFEERGGAGEPAGEPGRHDGQRAPDDEPAGECEPVGAGGHRGAHARRHAAPESQREGIQPAGV